MTDARIAFAHEAELQLLAETDPAAVGAAVTTALCGHWEHEGPCRWPHNNDIELAESFASFRTLFVAPATDEDRVELESSAVCEMGMAGPCFGRSRGKSQLLGKRWRGGWPRRLRRRRLYDRLAQAHESRWPCKERAAR